MSRRWPTSRRPIQWLRLPIWLTSSRGAPLLFATSTSTSPSLSTSPNAAPRPTSDSSNAAPPRAETSSNRPLPRLRNSALRWCSGNGSLARRSASMVWTAPFTVRSVQQAVVVDVEPGGAEAGEATARCAETRARALLLEVAAAVVDVEIVALAGQVGDEQILVAVVVGVAGVHAHAGLGLAVGAERGARQQPEVLERAVLLVHPQQVRLAVVGDVEVDPAVAVEVGGRHAQRRPEVVGDAGRRC